MRRYSEAVKADERANESTNASERGADFRRAGHPRDDPLQVEEDLATAGEVVPASEKEPEAERC